MVTENPNGSVIAVGEARDALPAPDLSGLRAPDTHTKVVGVIYPPPDIRAIVDKTAGFVARNGELDHPSRVYVTRRYLLGEVTNRRQFLAEYVHLKCSLAVAPHQSSGPIFLGGIGWSDGRHLWPVSGY
jgi:hypothetical protein